jgi:hypothetical protein
MSAFPAPARPAVDVAVLQGEAVVQGEIVAVKISRRAAPR